MNATNNVLVLLMLLTTRKLQFVEEIIFNNQPVVLQTVKYLLNNYKMIYKINVSTDSVLLTL